MKPIKSAVCALVFLFACPAAQATVTVVGDSINIGSGNSLFGELNAVIGFSNLVSQPYSLAIGANNHLQQDDNDYGSFALGHHNYIHGYGSIVGGGYNSVHDNSSITMGYYNYNNAVGSLVIGIGNVANYGFQQYAVVAGKYNNATTGKPVYFMVGDGTSSMARSNSFVIYADGDIVISKPQGDISMGAYE